jgi:hypothetical protein
MKVAWLTFLALGGCSEFSIHDDDERYNEGVVVVETFLSNPLPRVDILWVLDNTASMTDTLLTLSDQAPEFTDRLTEHEVSWHLGLVTTETDAENRGVLQGNPWLLTSSMPDVADAFAQMLSVDTQDTSQDAGLGAAFAALDEDILANANRAFRRPDAALHVVVASDGDDRSEAQLGDDPAEAFVDELDSIVERTGLNASLSAIAGPTPDGCRGDNGSALPGRRYIDVAVATGGHFESICDPDLARLADAIADVAMPRSQRFALQASPAPGSLRVQINGVRTDTGWNLDSNPPSLFFSVTPPAGSEIQARYQVVAQ